jgi:putative spermidine/putrescine transport system permease protein
MILESNGVPLQRALARATRRSRLKALALVLPLLLFVLVTFVTPIAQMLLRSVDNPQFSGNMPRLLAWFEANPAGSAIDESAFEALVDDLRVAAADRTLGAIGTRINYEVPGSRSLFTSTGRRLATLQPPYREALLTLNGDWGDPALWAAMRRAAAPYTDSFFLAALDRKRAPDGQIDQAEPGQRIYVSLFQRTFLLSAAITGICLLLGFPVAHLLATLPLRQSNLLLILVLLPFWTSLLVRTSAWMVLLQSQGVVNNVLISVGLIGEEGRLAMMYNRVGTVVAMTHILLPFMILPLYSVMKTIPPGYARAARSLGASSWTTFRRIYLPQTSPGVAAGTLLVFILAVGYYITPALVGGASGQLISNQIAFHMLTSLNWSLAAALATLLLGAVLLLYWVFDRLIGVDKMKLT